MIIIIFNKLERNVFYMARDDEKRLVIIHSVAPYEDAKSAAKKVFGWVVFLFIVILIVAAISLYYIGYYFSAIWWYPYISWVHKIDVIDNVYGSSTANLVGVVSIIIGFIVGVITGGKFADITIDKIFPEESPIPSSWKFLLVFVLLGFPLAYAIMFWTALGTLMLVPHFFQ